MVEGVGSPYRPADSAGAASILVVDDNADARGLVARALRRSGFGVREAASGEAAIAVVARERIGLVISDVRMPGMTGVELVRSLRGRPDTATLPVILMTGSDEQSVVDGLAAGADDFVAKPVRLDELVARARAHLRTQAAWMRVVEDELRVRTRVIEALGNLRTSNDPEEVAEAVVRELAERAQPDFVGVLQVVGTGLQELATYTPNEGVRRGARHLPGKTAVELIERARAGPWVEDLDRRRTGPGSPSFERAQLAMYASAPIHAGSDLVGLLSIGVAAPLREPRPNIHARLLAGASDYSSVLSAVAGRAIADRRAAADTAERLTGILAARAYHAVFQPIVDLERRRPVGFEALTRFDDGVAPDRRFHEAAVAGLATAFEIATMEHAIDEAAHLPAGAYLSVNVSPASVLDASSAIASAVGRSPRPIVLELTEHLPINDYGRIRAELAMMGLAGVAVDDAGAGYASFRHILELRPTLAKLDMSLVRGIDADDLRQSMAAGLDYFAARTGCRLVAEGIETEAEAATLARLGVELGQGYLFGRPERLPQVATRTEDAE